MTPNQLVSKVTWDKRERYSLSPPRYREVSSIGSVKKLFKRMGELWRTNRKSIDYLDLGCGDCRGTRLFADFLETSLNLMIRPIGIDASAKCGPSCKELNIQFLQLDLGSEPIPVKDCQVVTIFETIEHVFDTDFLLASIRNSLSKDGILLITTLNVVCWKNRILVPLGIQPFNTEVSTKKLSYGYRLRPLKRWVDTWKPAGHIRPFTLYSLQDMLYDNGFKVISSHGLENWRAFKFLEHIAANLCTGLLTIARPS